MSKETKKLIVKLILIVFVSIQILSVISCGRVCPDDKSVFIVKKVIQRSGQNPNITTYYVKMPDETDLGSVSFWFADSVEKYRVGDTLEMGKSDR